MSAFSSLFRKQKWLTFNTARIIKDQSLFKISFIILFVTIIELGFLALFYEGFRFLSNFAGIGAMVIDRLFALFYLGMGFMLVISSVITSYATIFRSEEVPFLITRPFKFSQIVSYKFLEATFLSSWAFFFIIIPFVGAYSKHQDITPLFAIWTFLFSLPFLMVCSGIGMFLVLLIARIFPHGRFLKWSIIMIVAGLIIWAWRFTYQVYDPSAGMGQEFNISKLIPGLHLASSEFIPSFWIAEGITSLARGQWFRGIMYLMVLTSTAAVTFLIIEWLGKTTFYGSWQRVLCGSDKSHRAPELFKRINRTLNFLPHDIKSMAIKDIRTFFRDPMQWSQCLIFFGLFTLYYLNLRSFNYQNLLPDRWMSIVGFMNVFGVSAVMCSLAARFIYPQLSLEGQGFWILGLSPTSMTRILLTKFILSLTCMLSISVVLMMLSSRMLSSAPLNKIVATSLVTGISFAICGLSTGLGAIFLDLKQKNPAAIVSGFGGTLNLVLCLGFLLAAILPFGMLFHMHIARGFSDQLLQRGVIILSLYLIVITAAATIIPIWLGIKSMSKREF